MEKDYLAVTKKITNFLMFLPKQLAQIEDLSWTLRDYVLNEWVKSNGVWHLYDSNATYSGGFISDAILDIFTKSQDEESANEELNYLLFKLCEEGYEIC